MKVTQNGVTSVATCRGVKLLLKPMVRIAGQYYGGGRDGACTFESEALRCPARDYGTVRVSRAERDLVLAFEARKLVTVEGLSLVGELELEGANGVLSNGFQSWSQSGVIAIPEIPTQKAFLDALSAEGEDEVYRRGKEFSYWHSFAGGGTYHFFAGATTAKKFRSLVQIHRQPNGKPLRVELLSGGLERVALSPNQTVESERWRVLVGADLKGMQKEYGSSLQSYIQPAKTPVPSGWNSWYDLWDDVKESDIYDAKAEKNADLIAAVLDERIPEENKPLWVVVDDGWQKAWGDWEPNGKFRGGIDGLADAVAGKGMRTGIWMAPLLVQPSSVTARSHPEWLVGGAIYKHPAHGDMRVLDVTHPEAAAHLTSFIRRVRSWGVDFLKIDFLFAGAMEGKRHAPMTGMEAYHVAMQTIRKAAGDDGILLAVGAPPVPTFPYVDGWRVGNDIAFKPLPIIDYPRPTWTFIANQARQLASRWPYCIATLCDADPPLLRKLPRNEVEAGAWVVAISGGGLFLSDDLTKLPVERREWALDPQTVAYSLSGQVAVPENSFPAEIPDELVNMKDPFNLFRAVHRVPSIFVFHDGVRLGINFEGITRSIGGVRIPAHSAQVLP
jgi:hypothetical protein